MNKKVKGLVIALIAVIILGVGGIAAYAIISNSSSSTVYNLCILNEDGAPITDTHKYLSSNATNEFNVSVDISTSVGSGNYYFTSSNKDVAQVVYKNDGYYVEYYSAGETIITAYARSTTDVYDSFKLNVYENFIADIVIDDKVDDTITAYGDNKSYSYSYVTTGVLANELCNNMLVRVVDNYNKNVFNSITIDTINQTVNISCKLLTADSTEHFYLQTYYIDDNGVEHVTNNFLYNVNVIGYCVRDIQLLVSDDYYFENNTCVCINNTADASNVFLLDGEKTIQTLVLTSSVDKLYFKIRVVYSNNSYVYSYDERDTNRKFSNIDPNPFAMSGGTGDRVDFWCLSVTPAIATTDITCNIEITFTDSSIHSTMACIFNLQFYNETTQSIGYKTFLYNLYNYDDGYYIYNYWDSRFRRKDAIVDEQGRILDFSYGAYQNPII